MAFSFGLLAKGLVGVLSVGTPIAVGVYYKDKILGTNKPEEGSKNTETDGRPTEGTAPQSGNATSDNQAQNPSTGTNGKENNDSTVQNPESSGGTVDGNSGESTKEGTAQSPSGTTGSSTDGSSGTGNS